MERVYLSKKEFQDIVNVSCSEMTKWVVADSSQTTDPELEGRRVFTFEGIQYVEKLPFEE